MGVNREGTLQYSKRILDGSSIDIYSKNEKAFEVYPLKSYVAKKRIYMEIDNGPLKKITCKNLLPFATGNLEIENHLKEANKFRILNGVLAGAALTSFVLIASSTIGTRSQNPTASMLIPIGLLIPIGITAKPLKKKYYNIVDIINSQP